MIYSIHENNYEKLVKKVEKFSKKIPDIKMEVLKEYYAKDVNDKINKYYDIDLEGSIEVNDWIVLAKLTKKDDRIKIHELNTQFLSFYELTQLDKSFKCDHCNKDHSRNKIYIIYNKETKEIKHVGSSCLLNYIDLDIQQYSSYLELIDDLEVGNWISTKDPVHYIELNKYLFTVIDTINTFGFVPKTGINGFNDNNTADVSYELYKVNKIGEPKLLKEFYEYLEKYKNSSTYNYNINTICREDYILEKERYMVASAYNSFLRNLDKESIKEQSKSSFIGQINDKIEVEGKVEIITTYETMYGVTTVYKIEDKDENIFIWKTSPNKLQNDQIVKLKGTIKEHNIFNGIKQTVLTRCKLIKEEN